MATGTILMVHCVKEATGTDMGPLEGFAELLASLDETLLPEQLGDAPASAIRQLPGVIAALDFARSDPDNLYLVAGTEGDRELAFWPEPGSDQPLQAGQSADIEMTIDFGFSQNISLFDYDGVSSDDLLGSITMFESEQGSGILAKLASSEVEQSAYYVVYRVD